MLQNLTAVRDNIRNRSGKRVYYLAKNDQLTSEARDFLSRERIAILPAEQAKPAQYRLANGAVLAEKPEHMTHLQDNLLVLKTHPRIAFRGAVDTLEAELLLCCKACPGQVPQLKQALLYTRKLLSREVMEEKVQPMLLDGMDGPTLRLHSQHPEQFYGQPHFMPEPEDSAEVLHLNRCRCAARQAELAAAAAFTEPDGTCSRTDLLEGFNRLSSFLYLLMIRQKA